MCNAVHHCEFDVPPPLLVGLPAKILYLGGADCCSVVTFDESGCSGLYGCQLLDTLESCRLQDDAAYAWMGLTRGQLFKINNFVS